MGGGLPRGALPGWLRRAGLWRAGSWSVLGRGLCVWVGLVAAGCNDFPGTPPPSSCQPGDRICYYEPIQDRDEVLRCNDGELPASVLWIVEDACQPEEVCRDGRCVEP